MWASAPLKAAFEFGPQAQQSLFKHATNESNARCLLTVGTSNLSAVQDEG